MNKISKYINAQATVIITEQLVKINCDHKWVKYGYGYKCKYCKYYTGTNDILNKQIKKGK